MSDPQHPSLKFYVNDLYFLVETNKSSLTTMSDLREKYQLYLNIMSSDKNYQVSIHAQHNNR